MSDLLFLVDLETGGLIPERHSIVQIACAAYNVKERRVQHAISFLVKQDVYCITEEAAAIHGITPELCDQRGIDEEAVGPLLHRFIEANWGSTKPYVAGWNVHFDLGFLARYGLPLDYHVLDLAGLALFERITGGDTGSLSMHRYALRHGLIDDTIATASHDAMRDVEICARILEHFMTQGVARGAVWQES